MNVAVNQHRCARTGFCVRIAPEVFELRDDEGPVHVVKVALREAPADLDSRVIEAESMCPTLAIRATSDGVWSTL